MESPVDDDHPPAGLAAIARMRPLLEQMMAQTTDAIIVCDAGGRPVMANAAARRLARPDDDGISMNPGPLPWAALYEGDRRLPDGDHPLARALRGETTARCALHMVRADTTACDLTMSAAPLRDDRAAVIGAVVTLSDVMEHRWHAEGGPAKDRRAQEQQVRAVLDSLFAFVGVLTPEGVLIEANRAPLQAAGIAFEDVCGKRFEDCYWWSYSPAVQADLRAALERAARGEAVRYDVDVRMAGGRLMTIDFMLAPLRDEAGQITHLIPSAVDITERKRAELRFRSLVEAVPIGVIRANVFGDILNANEAFLNLIGYTREALEAGRLRWIDITPAEFLPLDERAIAEARERGTCTPYEKTYRRKDGSLVPILIGYTLLGESREEAIAFILDLTEIKRAREALATALGEKEALLQQKETLLREVNHRVKNSLQLVSSLLLLQSRTVDDTAAQAQLTEAHNRVMTIAKIHEQLYTQSRTPDRIAFGPYLHALCGSVAGTAVQARERVRVAVEADAADLPTDEAVSLALIANELLTNAFKHAFTNSGSGTITVTFRVGSDGGRTLAVADDGCGLPTGADPLNGSGLGMRLIKALAGQLGGRLDAADAGHGARFTVALPARPA